jgi:hypothetical protein
MEVKIERGKVGENRKINYHQLPARSSTNALKNPTN